MRHDHILNRIQDNDCAREAHDRWMLHDAFLRDGEDIFIPDGATLEFDEYHPSNLNLSLPRYFEDAVQSNKHPYTASELAQMRLFKIRGLDAGFALKTVAGGMDIIAVHNNSECQGLAPKLLRKAKAEGGNMVDHFDGRFSSIFAKEFPVIKARGYWSDRHAPEHWKYEPVNPAGSDLADLYAAFGDNPPNDAPNVKYYRILLENYRAGRPRIIYRRV